MCLWKQRGASPGRGILRERLAWRRVLRGASVVFLAYVGFDAITTAAQETRKPQRAIPSSLIWIRTTINGRCQAISNEPRFTVLGERLQWVTENGEAKLCGSAEWIRTAIYGRSHLHGSNRKIAGTLDSNRDQLSRGQQQDRPRPAGSQRSFD
jgi:hypothetical protein